MQERSSKNMFVGPLLAGLAGAATALLLAPQSGHETRRQLRLASRDLKNQAGEGLDTARATLEEGVHRAKAAKSRLSAAITKKGKRADSSEAPAEPSALASSWEEPV